MQLQSWRTDQRNLLARTTLLTLKVGQVALLVEAGGLKTERVNDVVDLDLGILKTLFGLLSGSVGTGVYRQSC